MKITKSKLAQIVQEELSNTMSEAEQWKMGRSMKAADLAADPLYAAENQGIVDAQDDFMRSKRGEGVSPDLPSFGSQEEEDAYGKAWGKEWHRLMDNAVKIRIDMERRLNRPPEPMTDADREAADAELDFEATYSEGILDAIKNKLSPKRPAATKAPRDRRERNEHEKKAARQQGGADAYDFNRGMLEKPNRPNDEDYMAGWNSALQEGTNTMKITKSKLAQIVQEELKAALNEDVDWDAWEDGYDERDERGDPYEVGERRDAAIKQAIADAQKDFVLVQRGEELAPVPDNFIGTRDEEEAYGDAWGKEIARLQKRAELDSEPAMQEGANKMKITKSKLAQIVQEELSAVKAEGYDAGQAVWMEKFKLHARVPQNQELSDEMKNNAQAAFRQGMDPAQAAKELSDVKAEGYKAYKRDELGDDSPRIYPKRTLSRHAQELADRTRKGKSIKNNKAHLDAAQDSAEKLGLSGGLDEDGSGYSWGARPPPKSEPTVDEVAQDSGVQEMIYSYIEDSLEDGPLTVDRIFSLTEPGYESPYEDLADQWEDILEAALQEMSEGDDATIEKSHDTMTGEPYYSPIGFLS